ncbi:hypothetical protein D031_1015B, partial [Vibrio parahaemolyticus VP-48]
RRTSANCS